MKAYSYSIRHIPTGRIYYGIRKSENIDIGITYFSSSKLVKRMIREEGVNNFEFRLRKKFDSYEDARLHESKILTRIKAVSNYMVLNQAISAPRLCSKDPIAELKRKKAISKRMKELWQLPEYRDSQTFNKLSKEEYARRGRNGNLKRKNKISIKKKKIYRDVIITKNGIIKTIKANNVPAYRKIGWERMIVPSGLEPESDAYKAPALTA